MISFRLAILILLFQLNIAIVMAQEEWSIRTQEDWVSTCDSKSNLSIKAGKIHIEDDLALYTSKLKTFSKKKKLKSIVLTQDSNWDNWKPIPKVTPELAEDAPVFVPVSSGDYWFLARLRGDNANGYHSWHSSDMKSWTHYGPISTSINRWVTSAEYIDGNFYIYFDKPNDEDPHLIIDSDLRDGQQGDEIGKVFDDPSHGSDMGIMRDNDGTFHMIYEDWSPLNPRIHSWDSPLAGHSTSPDGIYGFEPHEFPPPIDERTRPTGKILPYQPHSNQMLPGIDLSPYNYEVHEGEQDAYGDYTLIKVGSKYYIFCDYDSKEEDKSMRIGRWKSSDISKPFIWDGEIGEGFHPDPTVGFAEGRFYLLVQRNDSDFISDGPWIDGVEVRVGVDTDNDKSIDQWTEFTKVKESYSQKEGFVRVIDTHPALMELSDLDSGYGFKVEIRMERKEQATPVLDSFYGSFLD